MPVNETLSLRDALAREELALDAVIINALYPARFRDDESGELEAALARTPLAPGQGCAERRRCRSTPAA